MGQRTHGPLAFVLKVVCTLVVLQVLENTVTSTFGRRSKARNFDVVQAVTKVLAQVGE